MNYRIVIRFQKCLYFNIYLYITWVITTGSFLFVKALLFYSLNPKKSIKIGLLGHLTKYLSLAVFTLLVIIEGVRVYLGKYGNLSCRVPELAGFLMLTVLMQVPLLSYFLFNPYLLSTPIEITLHVGLMMLGLTEIVLGFFALKQASALAKSVYLSHSSHR